MRIKGKNRKKMHFDTKRRQFPIFDSTPYGMYFNRFPFLGWVLSLCWFGLLPCGLGAQHTVSVEKLQQHVAVLAHDSMMGRLTGTPELRNAAHYIAGCMQEAGLLPLNENDSTFFIPWVQGKKRRYNDVNVAGFVRGNLHPEKYIVISAHYDHIGTRSKQRAIPFGAFNKFVKGDSIYNGANDNASGVSAMLELARTLPAAGPAYSLIFAAFSGEEFGMLGSEAFVSHFARKKIVMNINIEMLGRPFQSSPFVVEAENETHFLTILNQSLFLADSGYARSYFQPDPYTHQSLFRRSDHYSFHKARIPACTIMATDPGDTYYHSPDDEAETLQYEKMGAIVEAIRIALMRIVKELGK